MSAYNYRLSRKAEICIGHKKCAGWGVPRSQIPNVCPCNCPNYSHLSAGRKRDVHSKRTQPKTQHAELLKCWAVFITHRKAAVNQAPKKIPPGGYQMQSTKEEDSQRCAYMISSPNRAKGKCPMSHRWDSWVFFDFKKVSFVKKEHKGKNKNININISYIC